MQMNVEYAKKLLDGQYVFGHKMISCHDGHFVVDDRESDRWFEENYYGTQMIDGQFQVNDKDMVTFKQVDPVVDENTRFA